MHTRVHVTLLTSSFKQLKTKAACNVSATSVLCDVLLWQWIIICALWKESRWQQVQFILCQPLTAIMPNDDRSVFPILEWVGYKIMSTLMLFFLLPRTHKYLLPGCLCISASSVWVSNTISICLLYGEDIECSLLQTVADIRLQIQ